MKSAVLLALLAICILAASMAVADTAPAPIYMSARAIGGGALNDFTPGVAGGTGANNIGLLIRTYGKVTYVNQTDKYFYIDDGSGRTDGTRRLDNNQVVFGVRVSYGELAGSLVITPPIENQRVTVTGIVSTCMVGTSVQPNVRARHQDDIVQIP